MHSVQSIGKFDISKCSDTEGNPVQSCSELSVKNVTYNDSGLYSCSNDDSKQENLSNNFVLEWRTCGPQTNGKRNEQVTIITSSSLYVFVRGKIVYKIVVNQNISINNHILDCHSICHFCFRSIKILKLKFQIPFLHDITTSRHICAMPTTESRCKRNIDIERRKCKN